jgi:hypothetical protein
VATPKHNYDEDLAFAIDMVQEFGREVTFVKLTAGPTDTAKPWRATTAPRDNPEETITVEGVFVEPESLERLGKARASGDFIKSAEQVLIVASDQDLGRFDEVIDSADQSAWKIDNHQMLAPGNKIILHYFRVQRRGKATAVRGALL